jgi:RNA polymerase sigma-70 factor (ECF subfamily)
VAAAQRRRRARRIVEVFSRPVDVADDESLGPESSFADRQARGLVLEAMEALDLDRRAVFVMHDIDGRPVPEIALALDVPLNTVYSRLRLARETFFARVQKLRRRRGDQGGES